MTANTKDIKNAVQPQISLIQAQDEFRELVSKFVGERKLLPSEILCLLGNEIKFVATFLAMEEQLNHAR